MKINKSGKYVSFPGVNFISQTRPEDAELWQSLYSFLINDSEISKYYAPLPSNSYHMTLNNLYIKGDASNEQWHAFVDANINFFKIFNHLLQDSHFKFLPQFTINCTQVLSDHALQLIIQLSKKQKQAITDLAINQGIDEGQPKVFHITLAYRYKKISDSTRQGIVDRLINKVRTLFSNKTIELQAPTLHHFDDMTNFTPWDGSENPFSSGVDSPSLAPLLPCSPARISKDETFSFSTPPQQNNPINHSLTSSSKKLLECISSWDTSPNVSKASSRNLVQPIELNGMFSVNSSISFKSQPNNKSLGDSNSVNTQRKKRRFSSEQNSEQTPRFFYSSSNIIRTEEVQEELNKQTALDPTIN